MKSNTYHPPPVPVLPESRDLLDVHFLFLLKTGRSLITASCAKAPFRLANTIIRDLSHMSAVILLPFFPHLPQFVPNHFLLAFSLSLCSHLTSWLPQCWDQPFHVAYLQQSSICYRGSHQPKLISPLGLMRNIYPPQPVFRKRHFLSRVRNRLHQACDASSQLPAGPHSGADVWEEGKIRSFFAGSGSFAPCERTKTALNWLQNWKKGKGEGQQKH